MLLTDIQSVIVKALLLFYYNVQS